MSHPRALWNRILTLVGIGFGAGAGWFGYSQPENWKLWGSFLVSCALFLQQDGLMQLAGKVVEAIRAWRNTAN